MGSRYIRGNTNPVTAPVLTAQGIARGDLVGLSSGNGVAASDTTWDTNTATTQEAFVPTFLGVALQKKTAAVARVDANSQDEIIVVATSGVFEFDCASATFAVGDLVGPAKQSGNALENQKVVAVTYEVLAIGRVVEAGASVTTVKVEILSSLMPHARQSNAAADVAAAIVSLTDNSGGSANDTITAVGGLTTLTDSTGLSGTHDDTLAATTLPTTLTDSTGQSGTHDDTLAATTVPAAITGGESPTEAEHNAVLTLLGVMTQNASDTAQKVIEHNTLLGIALQNTSDIGQKVIEVVADIEDCKNNFADIAAKINAILAALRKAGIIAA